ncbi:MAG: efflux RND transporter periplasmic adaptor subunit [Eubacteriales bacterium]|nr:efflux RND transporter periplasmic adaptor subunit [Eubacteriales bacterium]
MTDQEYDQELASLMSETPDGGKKEKKKREKKPWSKRRKILTAAVAVLAAFGLFRMFFTGGGGGIPVNTQPLSRGTVEEILSINGPVSGTDSAEVVSRLHAKITDLTVKEGDHVEAGQVLARLDPADVQKEVEIARNDWELAVANLEEAQKEAENGYAKAVQDLGTAQKDHDRKALLYSGGDISQVEMEAAQNALAEAKRHAASYELENGRPVAARSYSLRVENARFALEQKTEQLKDTEVTTPIAGTVVRVNSRVGRFADTVDNDKPLFVIDNLEQLEMKISVSEYTIGKVKLGQTAEITADILDGETETGVVTAISPTGEEKGGGSTERVVPTTIQIQGQDTKLIAGITARARIILNRAENVWAVPASAVIDADGQSCLAVAENGLFKRIPVETGVEGDTLIEVSGEALTEGLEYIVAPDPSMEEGTPVLAVPSM